MKSNLEDVARDAKDLHRNLQKLLDGSPLSQSVLALMQEAASGLGWASFLDHLEDAMKSIERLAKASERAAAKD